VASEPQAPRFVHIYEASILAKKSLDEMHLLADAGAFVTTIRIVPGGALRFVDLDSLQQWLKASAEGGTL